MRIGVAIVGTYDDDEAAARCARGSASTTSSQFPNYPAPNADGYPDKVDVSRRLAFVFGAYPDSCDSGKPYLEGENVPAVEGAQQGHLRGEREELRRARRGAPDRQPAVQHATPACTRPTT